MSDVSFLDRLVSSVRGSSRADSSWSFNGFFKGFQKRKPAVETEVATPAQPVQSPLQENEVGDDFDFSALPPFTLADIRAAIPKHCWKRSSWRSMSYVLKDVTIVFALAAGAVYVNSWYIWPLYWFAQGVMFWAIFVLGHDCGHGSFSDNKTLNSFVGHLCHSSILVPYHGWRISHRTHHANHANVEKDESWIPLPESVYRSLPLNEILGRSHLPFPLIAYPFYLWVRSPGKSGSHYSPSSSLFQPGERNMVLTSSAAWTAMLTFLVGLTYAYGPMWMFKLYFMPYWIGVIWLDTVTYLHHHGYDKKMPWYRGKEWNYMRGGLTTIDRDYGIFNSIHHDIGTHVVHHLFPQIPHYHLIEATKAAKPVLGKYYREPTKSRGPFPTHLIPVLVKSFKEDQYVSDEGDVVFYQSDASKKSS